MSTELIHYVREVAEEFLYDIEVVQYESGNWENEEIALPKVFRAIDKLLESLAVTGILGHDNHLPSSELGRVANDLLNVGDLQSHARNKPHGYAGDYQMLTKIHDRTVCNDPLGRIFDEYFQRLDAPEAVRARIKYAGELVAKTLHSFREKKPTAEFHVASTVSGPAIDLEIAIRAAISMNDLCGAERFTLIDLDENALTAASERLTSAMGNAQREIERQNVSPNIRTVRENVFRLAHNSKKSQVLADSDCILCLGLFDYLSDKDASALLQTFWNNLNPGGIALIGNFDPQTKSRTYMEWISNWYLIFRSADEFAALIENTDIPPECVTIDTNSCKVNLMMKLEKTSS